MFFVDNAREFVNLNVVYRKKFKLRISTDLNKKGRDIFQKELIYTGTHFTLWNSILVLFMSSFVVSCNTILFTQRQSDTAY